MPVTWAELKTEIEDEYDLAEETFVETAELMALGNEAVEDAEKEIQAVNPSYFRASEVLPLVAGTASYDLPDDIFANKIELLMFDDGSCSYEIKPIRNLAVIPDICEGDDYRYLITNQGAEGTKIKIFPTPTASDATSVTLYYIRNVKLFTADEDELDIPEAKSFIKQYVVDKAANKENMTPGAPQSAALARKRQAFIDAIKVMMPDDNNEPLINECPYWEQVGY